MTYSTHYTELLYYNDYKYNPNYICNLLKDQLLQAQTSILNQSFQKIDHPMQNRDKYTL
jgi:hypothetical protein